MPLPSAIIITFGATMSDLIPGISLRKCFVLRDVEIKMEELREGDIFRPQATTQMVSCVATEHKLSTRPFGHAVAMTVLSVNFGT